MKIGDAELDKLHYIFYKDKFCGVTIYFSTYSNFNLIKQTLFSVYGKGYRPNSYMEKYLWNGESVVAIGLRYSEISKKGNISYHYMPIAKELLRDKKKKSEEAVKDL